MTDIKSHYTNDELRKTMEMLFYAYRDFTDVANTILEQYRLGRAHHRVIYFVRQYPDMTVSELLGILKITKQSLSRVLSRLIDDGFVVQNFDKEDKRKRLLGLTARGISLEAEITMAQTNFIKKAYDQIDAMDIVAFQRMLSVMMDESERVRFE